MTRWSPLSLVRNLRDEARDFQRALAEAPVPELSWDLLGSRALFHRAWWRLMREHREPARLAAAVFVGTLIGVSPFYGGHVLLALFCSFAFRLNKLAVWLATNISIPIFSPFLALASCQAGHFMLHGEFLELSLETVREAQLRDLAVDWLVGFTPVGVLLGGIFAAVTYRVAIRRQEADEQAPAG